MTQDQNVQPIRPESKGSPVRDALIGLLFRRSPWDRDAAAAYVDGFLLENPVIANASESLDLLAQVYPQVINQEDRDHIRELMSVTTPYMPQDLTASPKEVAP